MKDKTIMWTGGKITKPGVYAGVPLDLYHSQSICDGPSVSSSGLRRALEENGGSPAHFYCEWSGNPEQVELSDIVKKHFAFGRACHHWLLAQPDFAREFVFRPEELPDRHGVMTTWHGNKIVCQEWTRQAAAGGARWIADRNRWVVDKKQGPLTVLTPTDAADIRGIAVALAKNSIVQQGILNGHIERSFFWQDKRTGIWLKARPDVVPTDSGDYADLKTTTSVQWINLMHTVSDYAYHQQAALIGEGSQTCAGIPMHTCSLVFCEKKPPYCVRTVILRDEDVALGTRQNRRALSTIAYCLRSKRWPGPGEDMINHIDLLPNYAETAKLNCDVYTEDSERAA
jgi:PDDEXK-like domain of unknown function (DUF3799)